MRIGWTRQWQGRKRRRGADGSQRMLNAIEPRSVVPVHRHRRSSETVVCLRGEAGGGVLL